MADIKRSNSIDMCSGPMGPQIFKFTIPLILSSILQLLFNTADIIVVSNFCGATELAAVGSTGSLINLIIGLFVGMSTATNIIAARLLGERNREVLQKTVHTSILLSVVSGVFLIFIGWFFAKKALLLMGSPDDVIDLSTLYIKIYFIGMPASMVYNFGSSLLRAKGDTKRPLYIITLAGIINVILNLFLVIVCHRSVDGVAIATVVSQYVSALLVLICLLKEEEWLKLDLRKLKIHKKPLLEIIRIGVPAGIQGIVFSLSNVTIQSSINSFGKITMAGYAAASNIQSYVYMIGNAFCVSNMTFTSQNFGANNPKRIEKSLKLHQIFQSSVVLTLSVAVYAFAIPLLKIFSTDSSVIQDGIIVLKYIELPLFLCGVMEIFMGSNRGLGYSVMPMIVSMLGACGTRILWVSTVFTMFHTKDILLAIYPVSWIITALAHAVCFLIVYPQKKKQMIAE